MAWITLQLREIRQFIKPALLNSKQCGGLSRAMYSTDAEIKLDDEWENAKPYDSIPGPKQLPIIGHAWLFLPIVGMLYKASVSDIHTKLHKVYGKIFRFGSPPARQLVFVIDPVAMEKVYRNEGLYPVRDIASKTINYYRQNLQYEVFQGVNGMLTVQGEKWHAIRSKVNPILMRPQTILQYVGDIDSITTDLILKIRHLANLDGKKEMPADFMNVLYSWALESAALISVNKRLGCLDLTLNNESEALKIIEGVVKAFQLYDKLEFHPSFRSIYKTKAWKDFVEIEDYLTSTFVKYLKETEAKLAEESEKNSSVLQKLLKIDRKVAVATAFDTLFAGVDTTGKQTATILYYLAKNQGAQDLLRKELLTCLPKKESLVTKEILEQVPYLRAVIKEAERIAPIAMGNLRETVKDMVFCGYRIPKGTAMVLCTGIASILEENYPRPLEFLPERWLRTTTGELSHKNVNPFVTLPFGFGPRSCVGKRLANLEMEIGIAKMVRNFRIMWHYKEATFGGAPFVGIVDPLKFQFDELES